MRIVRRGLCPDKLRRGASGIGDRTGLCVMGSTSETGTGNGTSDTFGIIDVYASVPTGEAAFTGRMGAAALNIGYENDEILDRVGETGTRRTLALRSRHFLHAWEVRWFFTGVGDRKKMQAPSGPGRVPYS